MRVYYVIDTAFHNIDEAVEFARKEGVLKFRDDIGGEYYP